MAKTDEPLMTLLRGHLQQLRQLHSHDELPGLCRKLGLPNPPGEGSKWERLAASLESGTGVNLVEVAKRILEYFPPSAAERNALQELLWKDDGSPSISKKVRRDIAERFEPDDLFIHAGNFEKLLEQLWVIDDNPFEGFWGIEGKSLRAQIRRHVFQNTGDWTTEFLLDQVGAFDCSDRRFAQFLEGMVSGDVRPNVDEQRRFAANANRILATCGVELREVDEEGGYPVFRLIAKHEGVTARPKNLIFASPHKPDLRFRDAVNNDIEIVTNAEHVLIYDRPIGHTGLLWRDLQAWWSEARNIGDSEHAKQTLYRRLRDSLPNNSPPQRLFFESYFAGFGKRVPDLPALLPEVWLHWDPKTARERGPEALTRFRMDFLLLLPAGRRVVIEVDGAHHYATDERADPRKYAEMVSADRELRLAGYDVYRFGGAELQVKEDSGRVQAFFAQLFAKYDVPLE